MNDTLYLDFIRHLLKIIEDSDNQIHSLEEGNHELNKKVVELSNDEIPKA